MTVEAATKIVRRMQEIGVEMQPLKSDVYNPKYKLLTDELKHRRGQLFDGGYPNGPRDPRLVAATEFPEL